MLWTAQNLMGTYHSLEAEQAAASARAEAQKHLSEKVKDQEMLGSSTSYHSQEAYQKWQSALNEYERLKKEQERVRQELLLLTGFSPDSPVVLEKNAPARCIKSCSCESTGGQAAGFGK